MKIIEVPTVELNPALWNPNVMDQPTLDRLGRSIDKFGLVEPLVVRRQTDEPGYEVIGGSHRLIALEKFGSETAPCVVVDVDDADAMLMSQALNRIEGEDDPVKRGASLKRILESYSTEEVISFLPETAESMASLTQIGAQSPEEYLGSWNLRKRSRLESLTLQLNPEQMTTVREAISLADSELVEDEDSPNHRSASFAHICREFISSREAL